jgi:hypothetical protein
MSSSLLKNIHPDTNRRQCPKYVFFLIASGVTIRSIYSYFYEKLGFEKPNDNVNNCFDLFAILRKICTYIGPIFKTMVILMSKWRQIKNICQLWRHHLQRNPIIYWQIRFGTTLRAYPCNLRCPRFLFCSRYKPVLIKSVRSVSGSEIYDRATLRQ